MVSIYLFVNRSPNILAIIPIVNQYCVVKTNNHLLRKKLTIGIILKIKKLLD